MFKFLRELLEGRKQRFMKERKMELVEWEGKKEAGKELKEDKARLLEKRGERK